MQLKKWSEEEQYYELWDGYFLEKADHQEFAKYYAIYMNIDIGFKSSYEQKCSVVAEDDHCYWIKKESARVAGVFLEPNFIEGLFMIPPYQDIYSVLKTLKKVLLIWSDRCKEIKASVVEPAQVDYYQRLGFRISGMGRWMIRPTEPYDIAWNGLYEIKNPTAEDMESLGALFFDAFKHDVGRTKYSLEERTSFVKYYFDHYSKDDLLLEASTMIYDKSTQELIAACLVSEYKEWPLIYDVAVSASHRGRGLSVDMLKKAISTTNQKYPAIRLYVQCGNDAEAVYHKLGFIAGIKLTDLYIPTESE